MALKPLVRLLELLVLHVEVVGESMLPTYSPGERLWAERISYRLRKPRRWEVVVVKPPWRPSRLEMKRVIGLPGERVSWDERRLFINGREALRSPIEPPIRLGGDVKPEGEVLLGPDEYFVVGDNWPNSIDSRHKGPLRLRHILGRVLGGFG